MLNDEIKDYWEGESYVYSDIIKKSLNDEGKNAWADLVLGNAPKKEKLEILDVGTGPGFFPVLLGEKGHHVTGIDITENMIRRAAENISAAACTNYGHTTPFWHCQIDCVYNPFPLKLGRYPRQFQ